MKNDQPAPSAFQSTTAAPPPGISLVRQAG